MLCNCKGQGYESRPYKPQPLDTRHIPANDWRNIESAAISCQPLGSNIFFVQLFVTVTAQIFNGNFSKCRSGQWRENAVIKRVWYQLSLVKALKAAALCVSHNQVKNWIYYHSAKMLIMWSRRIPQTVIVNGSAAMLTLLHLPSKIPLQNDPIMCRVEH